MNPKPATSLKPIEYRQLCAIAREQLLACPEISQGEWADRIKDRLVQLGFAYPKQDQFTAAMSAVEHAVSRTMGPRVAKTSSQAEPQPLHTAGPTPAEWTEIARTVQQLLARRLPEREADPTPAARETFPITESELLDRFYRAAQNDRLSALKSFAELAVLREASWDPAAIRREHEAFHASMSGQLCFGCLTGSRPLAWHHVIQIQHGGSNTPRNRIPLCGPCHSAVHPWLPAQTRTVNGNWARLGDIADRYGSRR